MDGERGTMEKWRKTVKELGVKCEEKKGRMEEGGRNNHSSSLDGHTNVDLTN
jgi:hypothetical protein